MKSRESIGKRIIDSAPSIFRSTKDSSDILERTANLSISKPDVSHIELRNDISKNDTSAIVNRNESENNADENNEELTSLNEDITSPSQSKDTIFYTQQSNDCDEDGIPFFSNKDNAYDNEVDPDTSASRTSSSFTKSIRPNFSFQKAVDLYHAALEKTGGTGEIELPGCDPSTIFSLETFFQLHEYLTYTSEFTSDSMYQHLKVNFVHLTAGIQAAMQHYLLQELINKDLFWKPIGNSRTSIAAYLGFQPPVHEISRLGLETPYHILQTDDRETLIVNLNRVSTRYREEIEDLLLANTKADSIRTYDMICTQYRERFDTSTEISKWMLDTEQEWVDHLHSLDDITNITEKISNERVLFQCAFDDISDMLIMFAVKYNCYGLRILLRALCASEDAKHLRFRIPPFNTIIDIKMEDIPKCKSNHATSDENSKLATPDDPHSRPSSTVASHTPIMPGRAAALAVKPVQPTSKVALKGSPRTSKPNVTFKPIEPAICAQDSKGCYMLTCKLQHIITPKLICRNVNTGCPHEHTGCKLRHPNVNITSDTAVPSRNNRKRVMDDNERHQPRRHKPNTSDSSNQVSAFTNLDNRYVTHTLCYTSNLETSQYITRSPKRRRSWRVNPVNRDLYLLRKLCCNVTNIGVHVLNDCHVDECEMLVLSLGLNFVPPTRNSKHTLLTEAVTRFTRQVRIKKHFASLQLDSDNNISSIEHLLHLRVSKSLSLIEAQQRFEPTTIHCPIENYLKQLPNKLNIHDNTNSCQPPTKLSRVWQAYYRIVNRLRSRKDIIIKPSDKNLGVTVMSRDWYITQALSQLNNETVYTPIAEPPDITLIVKDLETIMHNQTWLSATASNTLLQDLTIDYTLNRIKLCRMYFIPKLHKTPIGMRPICASQAWITYWSSVYIHLSTFPLLRKIKSYISNSAELVKMLDTIKPPQHFQLLEADVDNLYPSIDINDGLHALKSFLTKTGMHYTQVSLLVNLTRWVLTNNYVTFGDKTFLQKSGTAMGTPCAVIFACIYMHVIEQEALDLFSSTRYLIKAVFLFVRFIDDLIAIVSDHNSGLEIMRLLNSRRRSIHFTFKIRNSEAQFLDLTLYKTNVKHNHQLSVRAYSKPMNKFLFLPPTSCHPQHVFSGWIVGYGRRLRRNDAADSDFNKDIHDFSNRLLARGYSKSHIQKTLAKIPSRTTIIESINVITMTQQKEIGVPFVITYSPEINELLPAIKHALSLTEEAYLDPHFPQIFGCRTTPLLSFKRGRNLRDMVAPSALKH